MSKIKTLKDLEKEVKKICSQDKWHRSTRSESDGKAGNIFEDLLGIPENNKRTADIVFTDGSKCEVKTNKTSSTQITLGGLSPVWASSQRQAIHQYGIRRADAQRFSTTLRAGGITPRGLVTEYRDDSITVSDSTSGEKVMSWNTGDIIKKLMEKCPNMVHTSASRRKVEGKEEYKYEKSYYYSDFNPERARKLLSEGKITIETRSKISHESDKIRDHGTVFRISQKNLPELFDNVSSWVKKKK